MQFESLYKYLPLLFDRNGVLHNPPKADKAESSSVILNYLLIAGRERRTTRMAVRTKFVKGGSWRTLEWFWNVTTTAFFRAPAGAQIKIRYSGWIFGVDRQKQTLDGESVKRLSVSKWSIFVARIQIRTDKDINVTYDVEPGNVAVMPPGISI